MNKNKLFWLIGLTSLIFVSFSVLYFYLKDTPQIEYSKNKTPTEVLELQNENYAKAILYEKQKMYGKALSYYQKALNEAQDKVQVAQIKLKMAIMAEWTGDYRGAIQQLKAIAADTENYPIARAYAVQEIGFMNIYTENDTRRQVFEETFKDSPYSSFKQESNLNLTYTNLFQYAASIYPLGYSEAYVAYGYSGEIMSTLKRATTTTRSTEYLSLIKESLAAANADRKRMEAVPGEISLLPEVLAWEGVATSRLAALGVMTPDQAESYFKESLVYSKTTGDRPGNFNTFNYAAFLVYHYGKTRKEDIEKVLTPFRIDNDQQIYPQVVSFFKSALTSKELSGDKRQIVLMGQMNQDFKKYLISLGWKETDF